jgi:ferredoxin-NADP reductase/ferredoxin
MSGSGVPETDPRRTAGCRAGTLLSVNVGMPKDVLWQGRTVFTGVFKDPVTGPRRVCKLNIDGDRQGDLAGHGGEQRAVFVYQMDSYRYWERELGRDDFVRGQFGENFTVDGLSDDEVCIGDRFKIGTATFEVTQPRVTCYRVGIRMNDPRIPALLVSHHRPGFYFRVLEEARECDSVISTRLEDPKRAPLPAARPGQYLTVRVQPHAHQRSLLRTYSLPGPPDAGYYRITVKRERDGFASGYLHTRLAVGDRLDIGAPCGTFILDQTDAPILLISAGIGATPVLAMLQALAEEHSDRQVWWLHGARSSRDQAFRAEVTGLLASLPNVSAHLYYSRPGPNDVEGRDYDEPGRLTASLLAQLDPPHDAHAYLCGPTPFMDEISAGLAAMGIDASRIHTEPFGPAAGLTPGIAPTRARAPHPPAGRPGNGPTIDFARSNIAIPWSSGYASLLELAEACDVPVRWSCRTGVCHNCETALIAGDLEYNPDPVEPPADGSALICCSQPRDNIVLDL